VVCEVGSACVVHVTLQPKTTRCLVSPQVPQSLRRRIHAYGPWWDHQHQSKGATRQFATRHCIDGYNVLLGEECGGG
jgi:hypothetical protein